MKIDPTLKITPPTTVSVDERSRTGKQQPDSAGPSPRESVQLSPLAAQLQDIESRLEAEQSVDTARVAEVKLAIAEGRFEVNAEKVADRLIDATRDFLRAQKQ
jgi:negative regulator of flagellin synthesis FlgM